MANNNKSQQDYSVGIYHKYLEVILSIPRHVVVAAYKPLPFRYKKPHRI